MKLGIGSYAYAWAVGIPGFPPSTPMTALTLVRRAAELGVRVVQFADNCPLHALSGEEQAILRRVAGELGISIEVGTRGIAPDHIRQYVALAQAFGSPILRVVVDTATHHPTHDELIATIRSLLPLFEATGVALAIENHDRFKVKTLVAILYAVNSPLVGICLDTVNSLGAGEGAEVVVTTLAPYVLNLHLKDYVIRRHPTMLGFEVQGVPAGTGMLDVAWLLDVLRGHGRDPNAILELWPPPEADVEATIRKEDAWVVASIERLRRLIPT
jgi:sugar phosphate isomerase/epimerase